MVLGKANCFVSNLNLVTLTDEEKKEQFTGSPVITSEDVRRINAEQAEWRRKWGNLQVLKGSFRCPWPCTRSQYKEYKNAAINSWLHQMDKEGWDLKSKVFSNADRRTPAYGWSGDFLSVPLLDQAEIPVIAAFQKRKVERKLIEVLVA